MSKIRVCDICGEPLTQKHYKVKRIYDACYGYITDRSKIDICSICWYHMEDYIKLKERKNGR